MRLLDHWEPRIRSHAERPVEVDECADSTTKQAVWLGRPPKPEKFDSWTLQRACIARDRERVPAACNVLGFGTHGRDHTVGFSPECGLQRTQFFLDAVRNRSQ